MRTFGIRRIARREEAALDPALRAQLERFCAGVNQAAARRPGAAVRDAGAAPGLRAVGVRSTSSASASCSPSASRPTGSGSCCGPTWCASSVPSWRRGSTRSTRPTTRSSPNRWKPGPAKGCRWSSRSTRCARSLGLAAEASGSNNWAVSGARSATGSPLIAGDPHLPPSMPGIWYEVELRHGGRFVRGASMPGMPGVYMGQNNDVCWTFTNVMADVQDLFVERIEGDNYLFEDEWRPLETVREEIVVKGRERAGRAGGAHHPPRADRQRGARRRRGRAAGAAPGRRCAEPTAFAGMFELLELASGPELVAKLEGHTSPASNLIWADRHGSIGYKLIGRLPMRRGGCPDLPKPGWTRRVRVGGDGALRGAAGGGRPRERLSRHRQQPHRRRRVPAPHHQRMARRLPRQADRRADRRDREARPRELRGDPVRQPLAAGAGGGAAALPPASARPARAQRDRAAAQLGRPARPDTIAGTIYQAFLLRLAREVAAARSATATSASAGSTATTTASLPTAPPPGAGTRT